MQYNMIDVKNYLENISYSLLEFYLVNFPIKLHHLCRFHEFLLKSAPHSLPVFSLSADQHFRLSSVRFNRKHVPSVCTLAASWRYMVISYIKKRDTKSLLTEWAVRTLRLSYLCMLSMVWPPVSEGNFPPSCRAPPASKVRQCAPT